MPMSAQPSKQPSTNRGALASRARTHRACGVLLAGIKPVFVTGHTQLDLEFGNDEANRLYDAGCRCGIRTDARCGVCG